MDRLTSLTDEAGTLTRSYDERGNLLRETCARGPVTLLTSYTYNPANLIASITYPLATLATYSRDNIGRVTAVAVRPGNAPNALPTASNITCEPFGPVKSFTYGNGVSATRTFDQDYRLTNLVDDGVQSLTYSYNAADSVLGIGDGVASASSQTFSYDALDRLTNAAGVYGADSAYGSHTYTDDLVGNRLTQIVGGTTTTYTYTPQSNRLIRTQAGGATQVFAYTPAGSITSIGSKRLSIPSCPCGRLLLRWRHGEKNGRRSGAVAERVPRERAATC